MAERTPTLSERLWDCTARVDRIIHFESMFTEPDIDLCEWVLDYAGALLFKDPGEMATLFKEDRDEFAWVLGRLRGWLVVVSTPVPRGMDEGHVMFSWGIYDSKCFLGETFEAALEEGIAWADGIWTEARAQADANKAAADG